MIVTTFIKWAGGKAQLIPELAARSPKKFNNYLEPFLGGGAFFFFIESKFGCKAILSDNNAELINTFEVVKEEPDALIRALVEHKKNHSKQYYYKIREITPNSLNNVKRAARFIYLNKTCFNGLYRVNSKGAFNVPIGSYKKPEIYSEKTIYQASRLLQNAELKIRSFERVADDAKKGDFVYFDPPYLPIKQTSFTAYTKDAFGKKEHEKLAEVFNQLDERGCFLMLSNSDTAFTRELYSRFTQTTVKAKRSINCVGSGRGKINELLITNYGVLHER